MNKLTDLYDALSGQETGYTLTLNDGVRLVLLNRNGETVAYADLEREDDPDAWHIGAPSDALYYSELLKETQ